jgi:hypothetical protein
MSTRRSCALLAAAIATSAAIPGAAQPSAPSAAPPCAPATEGEDEVVLESGESLRGTVIAIEPRVAVQFEPGSRTGEIRRLAWTDVRDIRRGRFAPYYYAPKELPPDPELPPSVRGGAIRLFLDAPEDARVIRRGPGWPAGYVCQTPCGRWLDPSAGTTFTFDADGSAGLTTISLAGNAGDITARYDPGSDVQQGFGLGLVGLSGVALAVGFLVALSAAVTEDPVEAEPKETAAWSLLGSGLGAFGLGLTLGLTSLPSIEIVPGRPASSPRP